MDIQDLNPLFGAVVTGLDAEKSLDADTVQKLRTAFDKKGLLLFRDFYPSLAFQNELAQTLIGAAPKAGHREDDFVEPPEFYVSNKEENAGAPFGRLLFHSDMMWSENAFQVLSLYGVEIEEPSVPTLFVSTTRAWATLPEDLRRRVEHRYAIHGHDAGYQGRAGGDKDVLVSTFAQAETTKLPIARAHPRTGELMLYVCPQMTHEIADMPHSESEALLAELFDHLYSPEVIVEHHWRKGDLVLWDNLALQHARPNVSTDGPVRTLRKVFAPIPTSRTTAPKFHRTGASA